MLESAVKLPESVYLKTLFSRTCGTYCIIKIRKKKCSNSLLLLSPLNNLEYLYSECQKILFSPCFGNHYCHDSTRQKKKRAIFFAQFRASNLRIKIQITLRLSSWQQSSLFLTFWDNGNKNPWELWPTILFEIRQYLSKLDNCTLSCFLKMYANLGRV